jgi:hypothetical protein
MTPKLTRPFVIQPTANGIAIFPLDMVKSGTLDLAQIQVFTVIEETYEYTTDPEKLLGFIRELVEKGETPLDNPDA